LSALPLLVITPILVLLYDLPLSSLKVLLPSLAIGTACLNLLGAISASLTLGARRATLLLALLLLPLSLPVLIFGVAITQSYLAGFSFAGQAKLLGAVFLFLLAVSPVATIAALRSVLEDK
jgi:heme exporter protein B